jgi:hypothetical protein
MLDCCFSAGGRELIGSGFGSKYVEEISRKNGKKPLSL